jgi:ferric-dicitrate binding protein FerR (iron transport regulator)
VNFNGNHIKLISRVVTGNASKHDMSALQEWIDMSEENKNEYQAYKNIWDISSEFSPKVEFDAQKSWDKMSTLISCIDEMPEESGIYIETMAKSRPKIGFYLARIAAVFVLAFGLYFLFNLTGEKKVVTLASAEAPESSFLLPDGSSVTLNRESSLIYPEEFASAQRLVGFEGEAFFEVAPNPDVPMIIQVENVRVQVLGTSFNLSNYTVSNEIVLHLKTGKVLFSSIDPLTEEIMEQIVLLPGQIGIYNKVTRQIYRETYSNENFLAWKTGVLVFDRTPLSDVFSMIEKTYNIRITGAKAYNEMLLTATYTGESVESIFESLYVIFGIEYSISATEVTIQ